MFLTDFFPKTVHIVLTLKSFKKMFGIHTYGVLDMVQHQNENLKYFEGWLIS